MKSKKINDSIIRLILTQDSQHLPLSVLNWQVNPIETGTTNYFTVKSNTHMCSDVQPANLYKSIINLVKDE